VGEKETGKPVRGLTRGKPGKESLLQGVWGEGKGPAEKIRKGRGFVAARRED